MLNFYVVSAGPDLVNDSDRSTTCRSKFRAPPLQRKENKKWTSWPKDEFHLITVWIIQTKNWKLGIREQNKGIAKLQRLQLKMDLVTRKK